MLQKEEKETKNTFFSLSEESEERMLLGKKQIIVTEDKENKNNSLKTNIHGIILKKKNSEKTVKKIACNCKNSRCLKLYCKCFSKLAFCDPEFCSCTGCANTKENEVICYSIITFNLFFEKNKHKNKLNLIFL
jgi:hypothetical protein